MRGRMRELILLVVAMCEVDEDSEVVFSRGDFDAGSCKLGRQLIKSARSDALFRTVYEECRDRWVVGCLLCEV